MIRSTDTPAPRRRARHARAAAATAVALALVATTAPSALAHGGPRPPAPQATVTRAGLDPALVADRGADVPFLEQEAENGVTTGTVIGPGRDAYTIEAEASGRSAVRLEPGQHVELTLPADTNAITVRYALPDAPTGGGITAPLDVSVLRHGTRVALDRRMTLTSEYSYLYNQYPFSNDPTAGPLQPGWWMTECACVPAETSPAPEFDTPFRPMKFYDEQRLLLGRTFKAGDTIRLTMPRRSSAEWTVIDLLDTEKVAPPTFRLRAANALLFGADPTGRRDSADALDRAIAYAQRRGLEVYVPPGIYQVNRHIMVDDVSIRGAGSWYTIFRGQEVALDEPAADGSVHTGVGFYGKDAADGGSHDVHLRDFAIVGDVRERIDTDQVNGVGGALNDSSVSGLYIQHTKVGMWFDGPMENLTVEDNVIVDQIADALNFHGGVTDSVVRDNFVRGTGDDGLAMWSETNANVGNTFEHNTVQSNTLANGIAIYGGTDNTVAANLVADPVREGSGLHVGSRFGAEPFAGTLDLIDNTTVRAGTYELNWNIGLGAIWFYALDRDIDADIHVTGDHYLDSTYNAIMLVSDWGVKDDVAIEGVAFKDVQVDGTGTSVVSARVAGGASFENVDARNVGWAGVNNCGSFNFPAGGTEFTLTDLGGNDGTSLSPWEPGTVNWLGRFVPDAPSCNDRPPVVAPPAPSSWVQPVG
ncbi:glycosyl hydrolase family 28-related protein [Cellulosimicrobium arenosum]|uniref:Right-handed parallel beta-helix repeat-containing protein n=1 Tax=Cellulosimicrobium arenosum TaxID=2708133 RepID=A0A927PEU8_9MICO|nr:glycosyl hydrolase family 28-related protein [Cellulosimicrobium arenosum]MBD8080058.1 right-handed parallel beta-helix repeat-containing protein [Cellulosimicrobium arenosum]